MSGVELGRRKLGPAGWAIIDQATGRELGRYGGRPGDRWAENLVTGEVVTEDSACSAGLVRSLLERSIREALESDA